MRASLALLATLLLSAAPLVAQEPAPPPIVVEGLRLAGTTGIEAAVAVWFRGSSLERDTAAAGQIISTFHTLPEWLGRPKGFEVLKTFGLGTHLKRTYAMILLEGGPIYLRFTYYLTPADTWILQNLDFNTDPSRILPTTMQLP